MRSKLWHKLLLLAEFITLINTGNASDDCQTKAGKDCIFPFTHKSKVFYGCTTFDDPNNELWCSTKVKSGNVGGELRNDIHVTGGGHFGPCSASCPIDTSQKCKSSGKLGTCKPKANCPSVQSSSKGDCDKSSHVCCIEQQGNRAFEILKANLPEKCRTPQGKGLCKSASKCTTVSAGNKKQGGCSKRSEVCCYYETPKGVTDRLVTRALSNANSLRIPTPDSSEEKTGLAGFNFAKGKAWKIDLASRKLQEASFEIENEIGIGTRSSSLELRGMSASAESSAVRKDIKENCPWTKTSYKCTDEQKKYRDIDGSCNSLTGTNGENSVVLGKSFTPFKRLLDPAYAPGPKGFTGLRRAKSGSELPSARLLSTTLAESTDSPNLAGKKPIDGIRTVFLMQMGQFIDHDLAHSPNFEGASSCCVEGGKFINNGPTRSENCIPIDIPSDDEYYSKNGQRRCMPMMRAMTSPNLNCELSTREQMNQLTHWLDGSNIYGSEHEEAENLREGRDGLLKSTKQGATKQAGDEMLPQCDQRPILKIKDERKNKRVLMESCETCPDRECDGHPCCFIGGDFRANEHHALLSMHTIWVREHNRVAKELKKFNSRWNDEKLYQEARRIVVAEYQHIIYTEWLPHILGIETMNNLGITPISAGHSKSYLVSPDYEFDPSIANEFATAAYRFGHSLIPPKFKEFGNNGRKHGSFQLRDAFFKPEEFRKDKGGDTAKLTAVVKGLSKTEGEPWDNVFAEDIVNHLFEMNGPGSGSDLVAINIQRGRDHGIPGYNDLRELCGKPKAKNFDDLSDVMVPDDIKRLKQAYEHVDDIDLFAGGFLEQRDLGANAILGPVFRCIVADGFMGLKYGDRFWYDLGDLPGLPNVKFTLKQLSEIRKSSMARIVCDNTLKDSDKQQPQAFRTSYSENPETRCDDYENIPKLDFSSFSGLKD